MARRSKQFDWSSIEVRRGSDGKVGVYIRAYNLRLATFNANTRRLQEAITALIEDTKERPGHGGTR